MSNMEGKICLVTGATSGIGRATAFELARMGATVVIVARNPGRGEETRGEVRAASANESVDLLLADLGSLVQVRQLAREFETRHPRLHVLVNNAGTIFPARKRTEDGFETTFSVNHLAPFLLTSLLMERLKASAPARIVNVASASHRFGAIDFARLRGGKEGRWLLRGWRAYNESKLANVLFTYELSRRLEGTGVTANCLHPGLVATNAASKSPGILWRVVNRYRSSLVRFCLGLPHTFLRTPEQGAETSVFLASSPEIKGMTGKYFVKRAEARSSKESYDPLLAYRLWRLDEELVGFGARAEMTSQGAPQ
jgi:NAD(P)-dependent dehydrogenase (short-subunit alcohol dehydrogenase family)